MIKVNDLTGQRFERLTVIERDCNDRGNGAYWICKCDCGNYNVVRGAELRNGHTKSCGCQKNENTSSRMRTHGMRKTRLYNTWQCIRARCYNEKIRNFRHYGGKGIAVCDEWRNSFESFRDWAMANGYNDSLTIDRIDVDGDYCPENCRWVDMVVQENNTSRNHYLTYKNETRSMADWARIKGLNYHTLRHRISLGWSVERALEEPIRKWN